MGRSFRNGEIRISMFALSVGMALALALGAACAPAEYQIVGSPGSSHPQLDPSVPGTNPPPGPNACDPFGGGGAPVAGHGIYGTISYLTADQPRYSQVADYLKFGHAMNINLYLNQINVPTRVFTTGLVASDGNAIADESGKPLIEYFALHLNSTLTLPADQPVGDYQLAILSDDGSVLNVRDATGSPLSSAAFIDNDGIHATRMGCATQRLHLERGTRLPIQLDYFQGPRFYISLVLLWRPWPSGAGASSGANSVNDPLCGVGGDGIFFDSATLQPLQAYQDLVSRGWKPIPSGSFLLPAGIGNGCVKP